MLVLLGGSLEIKKQHVLWAFILLLLMSMFIDLIFCSFNSFLRLFGAIASDEYKKHLHIL